MEPHLKESSIRDLVFGFGDGINTSLGIIAGVGGAAVAADMVILAALVGMFTGVSKGNTAIRNLIRPIVSIAIVMHINEKIPLLERESCTRICPV